MGCQTIPREAIHAGAEQIDDLLTMLGVNPSERPEEAVPDRRTVGEVIAGAAIRGALPFLGARQARAISPQAVEAAHATLTRRALFLKEDEVRGMLEAALPFLSDVSAGLKAKVSEEKGRRLLVCPDGHVRDADHLSGDAPFCPGCADDGAERVTMLWATAVVVFDMEDEVGWAASLPPTLDDRKPLSNDHPMGLAGRRHRDDL